MNYSTRGSHGASSTSAGDWQGDHDMQVAVGNDAWVSVFGGHSDPELSDGASATAMGWKAEHERHVAVNNTNWIHVYGSSSDMELSDAKETLTEGASSHQKGARDIYCSALRQHVPSYLHIFNPVLMLSEANDHQQECTAQSISPTT
ncbi:hypothetical protein BS47DRAFT_1358518 [Hydnum rufescens UP504]|uniref:Uncharacterized protein n=1 Tax=Hydnum rufescens UP504 TaxID=1448309 RepID=A0A9P6E145_9AGAM|nr:hypothetical protein BS47DRAFT_1358518 [Hydnum rufescens UP504]